MPASRTSAWALAARAFGAREPDANVRNPDFLAERFFGPEERDLLAEHPLLAATTQSYSEALENTETISAARVVLVRTHYIDGCLKQTLRDGVQQIVILGAGFDSRAYRFADELKDVHVIEVDQPDTQRLKVQRVETVLGGAPAKVKYAAIDFTTTSLGDGLARAGYERGLKTFFIWEGVTMYLSGDVVRETLRWISTNAASGSSIVFDYAYKSAVTWLQNSDIDTLPEPAKQAAMRFRRIVVGEPWIFGLPDGKEKEFLSSVGLELRSVMGVNSSEAIGKYLTRADGSVFGTFQAPDKQWYLILVGAVGEAQAR